MLQYGSRCSESSIILERITLQICWQALSALRADSWISFLSRIDRSRFFATFVSKSTRISQQCVLFSHRVSSRTAIDRSFIFTETNIYGKNISRFPCVRFILSQLLVYLSLFLFHFQFYTLKLFAVHGR